MDTITKIPRGNEVLPKALTTAMNNLLLIWVKRVESVCGEGGVQDSDRDHDLQWP